MATLVDLIGVVDNLGEPEPILNRKRAILGIVISFQTFTWMCVLFRLYTRFIIVRAPGWDDLFVILSALSTTAGGTAIGVMTTTGMGKHFVQLPEDQVQGYLRAFWVANATYPVSTSVIKLALLLQYIRIFEPHSKLHFVSMVTIYFTALWGLAYSVLAWFPTVPVSGYWNLTEPATRYGYGSGHVGPFVGIYESHAAVNMMLDAVMLVVAVPLFFKPGLQKKSYWGLLGLFMLGGIVNMLSIWRLQNIVETQATTHPTFDPTWYGATPIVLSSMEVDLATICASLPVFWPVITKNVGQIFVTHEVKITREHRRTNSGGDDVELQRQNSEANSTTSGGIHIRPMRTSSSLSHKYDHRDPLARGDTHVEVVSGKNSQGYLLPGDA